MGILSESIIPTGGFSSPMGRPRGHIIQPGHYECTGERDTQIIKKFNVGSLHRSRFMVEEVDRGLGLLIAKGAMGVAPNAKYINPNYMLLDLGNNNRMIP